jgi:predicted ATPase
MVRDAQCRMYHKTVFITPPWEQIYRGDEERRQSFGEAVETFNIMKTVYNRFGYDTVELPKIPVIERAAFITENLRAIRDSHLQF